MSITCRSAGDAGDCIFQLPAVKYLCARDNQKAVFFIEAAKYTRVPLTPDNWRGIDKILKAQPYIEDVREWNGERVNVNLNDFRALMFPKVRNGLNLDRHISDWVALACSLSPKIKDEPWLNLELNRVAPVVISRAGPGRPAHAQYYGKNFPWGRVVEKYRNDAVFVGTQQEHEIFSVVHGSVPFYPTASLYEAAQVIAGADLFIGNQSCPHAIAQGLGITTILEVWAAGPNCLGFRENHLNVWDHQVNLPDL